MRTNRRGALTAPDSAFLRLYPESRVGGFSSVDGTIEFYSRVNSLLVSDMTVLDVGAGRGIWFLEDRVPYRRALRTMRGKVDRVIGIDPDAVVLENPSLDEGRVMAGAALPIDSGSIDLIICDSVFEHVADPTSFIFELERVLKPGGWLCARTPNRFGYPALVARVIPNALHARVLRRVQPTRDAEDVFPTWFRLNTRKQLSRYFREPSWSGVVYSVNGEPSYAGTLPGLWDLMCLLHRFLPRRWSTGLVLFSRWSPPTDGKCQSHNQGVL
jgi:2-polyprenyl-3-methyl-5-hydroxy-6-metoxy-1,4-benzoquinol methylase